MFKEITGVEFDSIVDKYLGIVMEQKTESNRISSTDVWDFSCSNIEDDLVRAKELRAEAIFSFIQAIGQRIKRAQNLRKAAKQEQLVLSENAISTAGRPCF